MCSGAREHKCWNGITVDGPLAAGKISEVVFGELEALEGFDAAFLEMVEEQARHANEERGKKRRDLSIGITRNEREPANVAKFIREGRSRPTARTTQTPLTAGSSDDAEGTYTSRLSAPLPKR